MLHPDTELRFVSEAIGLGVFATRMIRKGTIVWARDELDMALDRAYVMSLEPLRRKTILKYAYIGEGGRYVLCWDHGRYVNHSSNPNITPTPYGFELAVRDILPGGELRCDYGSLGLDASFECVPEEGTCRTRMMADDYLYFYRKWDEMAREAFTCFNLVDQPLRHLIKPEHVDTVSAIAAGQRPPDSLITVYRRAVSP